MGVIKAIRMPLFRTGDSLDQAMTCIKAHTYPYDPNTIHSLVMYYHNTLLKVLEEEGRLSPGDETITH